MFVIKKMLVPNDSFALFENSKLNRKPCSGLRLMAILTQATSEAPKNSHRLPAAKQAFDRKKPVSLKRFG
jgi:hypothetical protein